MPDKGRLQCVVERNVECVDCRQVEAQEVELAPTLVATDYKGGKCVYKGEPVCFENHGNDSRVREIEVSSTITCRAGTGGNNVDLVMEHDSKDSPVAFIKNDAGGEQQGFWEDMFPTLRSGALPAVAYNVTFCDANGRRKDRPNGGLYVTEAEASKTVTAGGTNAETVVVDECVPLDLRNATRDPNKKDAMNRQSVGVGEDGDPMNTLTVASVPGVGWQAAVRKHLPAECESYTRFPHDPPPIGSRGKQDSDRWRHKCRDGRGGRMRPS